MDKKTFEHVKAILTSNHVWANDTSYSLSLSGHTWDDLEYYRIVVYPNNDRGSFHDGIAAFFCKVADVTDCNCSFRSENNVCVCAFY